MAFLASKPAGAFFISSSVTRNGRMVACGQTMAHWLHWMQLSMIHSGTFMATPALFVLGGGHRKDPVRGELADRQLVALLGQDGPHDRRDPLRLRLARPGGSGRLRPGGRVFDFHQVGDGGIHGGVVHGHELLALLAEHLLDFLLQVRNRLVHGQHVGELEEGGLHDHVDAAAEAHLLGDLDRVDVVELDLLARDGLAHGGRQLFVHVGEGPGGVEHEGAALA